MGRPAGSQNKLTIAHKQSMQKLVAKYGDPIAKVMKVGAYWSKVWEDELAKSSKRRNWKKIREAQEALYRVADLTGKKVHPDYTSITYTDETRRSMVARVTTISDSKEWIDKSAPKEIARDAVKINGREDFKLIPQPASPALIPLVEKHNETVRALSAAESVIERMNRQFLEGYDIDAMKRKAGQ